MYRQASFGPGRSGACRTALLWSSSLHRIFDDIYVDVLSKSRFTAATAVNSARCRPPRASRVFRCFLRYGARLISPFASSLVSRSSRVWTFEEPGHSVIKRSEPRRAAPADAGNIDEGLTTTPSKRQLWLPILWRTRRLNGCMHILGGRRAAIAPHQARAPRGRPNLLVTFHTLLVTTSGANHEPRHSRRCGRHQHGAQRAA